MSTSASPAYAGPAHTVPSRSLSAQAPYQSYGPPPAHHPPEKGAGLVVASMVLGIIALLFSWVPIINDFAAILAVDGLGLGIPVLLRARRGTHDGKPAGQYPSAIGGGQLPIEPTTSLDSDARALYVVQ